MRNTLIVLPSHLLVRTIMLIYSFFVLGLRAQLRDVQIWPSERNGAECAQHLNCLPSHFHLLVRAIVLLSGFFVLALRAQVCDVQIINPGGTAESGMKLSVNNTLIVSTSLFLCEQYDWPLAFPCLPV